MGLNHGWRGPSIVRDGLVLYLDAGSPNSYLGSGTTWKDISKFYQNDGTLTNGPVYSSANEGVITFDGVNDFVSIPYNPVFETNTHTLDFWVKFSNLAIFRYYIANYGVNSPGAQWYIRGFTNYIEFVTIGTGTPKACFGNIYYNQFPGGGLQIGKWYNFALTYTTVGDLYLLYIDGAYFRTIPAVNNVTRTTWSTDNVTLAGYPGAGPGYTAADFGGFKFYNRVLSSSEILQNYNATKGRFGL